MRFSLGCLLGLVLGVLVAAGGLFGYTYFNSRADLPLFPAASTGAADVTITIGEQYLNQEMRAAMTRQGLDLGDLNLKLHAPNRAESSATLVFTLLGQAITVRPRAQMHFGVSQGLVTFDVDNVDVSGISVPPDMVNRQVGNLKQTAQDQINADVKRWLANTGLHLVSVQATETELIVKLAR